MTRRLLGSVFLLSLSCATLTAMAANEFDDIAILGTNSVYLQRDTTVTGDVAVNAASAGPVLSAGVELDVDRGAVVNGNLAADSIDLSNQVTVNGIVSYNELIDRGATTGGQSSPLPLPVFTNLPAFQQAVVRAEPPTPHAPGLGENVFVPANSTVTLSAGDYGDITIEGGGAGGGTLLLSGGVFNVRSIGFSATGGQCAFPCRSINFSAPTDLRVAGRIDTERNSHVGPASGSEVGASEIFIYAGGVNGATGALGATPPAVGFGRDSVIEANVYAPNGTLLMEQGTDATGAFIARDVKVDKNTTVVGDSGFVNQPPVANPQTVFTNGANDLVITLAGSDPERGDLMFSIASGPNPAQGSLGAVTPIVPAPVAEIDRETGLPTGNMIQPPITSATVTYTPVTGDDEPNSFTFQVEDDCGKTGMAVVEINPADTSPPAPGLDAVEAENLELDVLVNATAQITLDAGAPPGDTLVYSILSLPTAGSLSDSVGPIPPASVPYPLNGATVFYTAGGAPGSDMFDFEACGSPSLGCDTATVLIGIDAQVLLAEDRTFSTELNVPVLFTLSGNPGGSGTPQQKSLKALPGADIAGNVSDATGDGLGDGRDNLPGPAPVLVAAGVDINLGATPSGSITDPAGDATNSPSDDPANPDLVSASVSSDGTNLNLSVRFVPAGFSSTTSRGSFVLDIDENPATGFPGVDAANNDSALMGVEFLVNIGADLGANAQVLKFISLPNIFSTVGSFAATALTDGYDVSIPLSAFDNDDGRMTFKAETQSFLGPGFTGILDYAPNLGLAPGQSRTGVQGVARVQIEWDIDSLVNLAAEDIESARVVLNTEKGTVDDLDTMFFVGTQDQDGVLSVSDFQTEAEEIAGVVMPVPAGPTGQEGTFTFDVTNELRGAVGVFDYFTIQARVNEALAGQGFRRGLQIRSTATGNLTAGKEPKLEVVVSPDTGLPLVWKVLTLPPSGTVKTLAGTAVTVNQTFTTAPPTLVYTPTGGGTFEMNYEVTEGLVVANALVRFIVSFNDACLIVGRPLGCAPAP